MIPVQDTILELKIPASLISLGMTPQKVESQMLEWAVISLFQDEVISSGKAAQLLGISRASFIALLGRRGLSYLDQSAEELVAEQAVLDTLGI
jgi:predicted HTH domain antitoxin